MQVGHLARHYFESLIMASAPHETLLSEIPSRGVTAIDGTTKARIERAALRLFSQGAMDKATTRAIAREAGISEGALYRHYTSKDDIWRGLFFTIHARLGDLVTAAGLCADHIEGQAAALVNAYCQTADDDWQLFCFHLLALHRFLPSEENPALSADPVSAAENIVRKAMQQEQIRHGDPVLVAGMALGVVLQPALHKAYGRINGNLCDRADELTQAVLAVLAPQKRETP